MYRLFAVCLFMALPCSVVCRVFFFIIAVIYCLPCVDFSHCRAIYSTVCILGAEHGREYSTVFRARYTHGRVFDHGSFGFSGSDSSFSTPGSSLISPGSSPCLVGRGCPASPQVHPNSDLQQTILASIS
jgi:hypothetical protein